MAQATRNRRQTHYDDGAAMTHAPSHLAARDEAPLARVEEPRFDIFSDVVPWFFIGAAIYSGAALLAVVITGAWLGYRMMLRRGVRIQEIDPREWRIVTAASDIADRVWNGPRPAPRPAQPATADEPATTRAQAAPAVATPQQQGAARKAAQARERPRWIEIVNDEPDKHPHVLILGGTGAGKTTMAKAIIGDRGGRTVVLAPKVSPKGWVNSGAEIITLDDDCTYAPIVQALQDIDEEKRRRSRLLRTHANPRLEPLTIVLDDIQDLCVQEPAAGRLMVNLSSIGRELNMRLIGIGTTDDALNIQGWKASRNNYVRIETNSERRGTLSDGTRTLSIQAQDSKRLADAARLQPWRGGAEQLPSPDPEPARHPVAADAPRPSVVSMPVPAAKPAADLDFLLDDLLAQPVPAPEHKPSLDERIAAALGAHGLTAQGVVKVEGGGPTYVINAAKAEATAPVVEKPTAAEKITKSARRRPREGAINVRARQRKLERKAYYEQAAWKGLSLQAAYDARPKGEKGDYNEAANWYREAKRTMKAS